MAFPQTSKKKWRDSNPETRMEAIREVSSDDDNPEINAEEILAEIIREDKDSKVRLYAISHLSDVDLLVSLQSDASSSIQQAASNQYYRILSGSFDSPLSEQERVKIVDSLEDSHALLLIAKESSCDSAGLMALNKLEGEDVYATIVTEARSSSIRTAAAEKISDLQLVEKLSNTIKHKDKNVYKLFKHKLNQVKEKELSAQHTLEKAQELTKNLETLKTQATNNLTRAQLEYVQKQWSDIADVVDSTISARFSDAESTVLENISAYQSSSKKQTVIKDMEKLIDSAFNRVIDLFKALAEPVIIEVAERLNNEVSELNTLISNNPSALLSLQNSKEIKSTISSVQLYLQAFHKLESNHDKLHSLKETLDKCAYKDTNIILKSVSTLGKLHSPQQWPKGTPGSSLLKLAESLSLKLVDFTERNRQYQKNVISDIENKLQLLIQHIEDGQSVDARKNWDKIHSALTKLDDKNKVGLQKKTNAIKPKLDELCDWKDFASTEKKKSLIAEIKTLSTSTVHAEDRSKRIKKLHEEWKKLGHSNDNNTLWFEFKKYSDAAYEPCKEFFKQKKAKLKFNLQQRKEICDQLEHMVETIDLTSLHISKLTKIENKASTEWKTYAPVEQSKIRAIQKRFNDVLNKIRHIRRGASQENANAKKDLITRARKLSENEDIRQSMNEAKELQKEWKNIGPSSYKADQKYWSNFREACDNVFKQRDQQAQQKRDENTAARGQAQEILVQLNEVLTISDEKFPDSKKLFSDLQGKCSKSINSSNRQDQNKLRQQLDAVGKKYEARRKSLPDRKTIQLLGSLKEKAALCEQLEDKLLDTSNDFQRAEVDTEIMQQWSKLDNNKDGKHSVNMNMRLSGLKKIDTKNQLNKILTDNIQCARKICVEIEIHANIDSPDNDKELRMQCQLDALKKDFGQQKLSGKSNIQLIRDLGMDFLCLGPLKKKDREMYNIRINAAQQKMNAG